MLNPDYAEPWLLLLRGAVARAFAGDTAAKQTVQEPSRLHFADGQGKRKKSGGIVPAPHRLRLSSDGEP
jgi:hypothetical protein